MDPEAVLSYHEDRIGLWQEQLDAYRETLNSYEYFEAEGDEEEAEALVERLEDGIYESIPAAKERAYDSFLQLLDWETKLSNSLSPNRDMEYDELPDAEAEQEQFQAGVEELKQLYHDIREEQEDTYDRTEELFGPFLEEKPPTVTQIPVTGGERQTGGNNVNTGNPQYTTSQVQGKRSQRTSGRKEVPGNSNYVETAKKYLSDSRVQNALAVGSVFGAAWLGNRMRRRNRDE